MLHHRALDMGTAPAHHAAPAPGQQPGSIKAASGQFFNSDGQRRFETAAGASRAARPGNRVMKPATHHLDTPTSPPYIPGRPHAQGGRCQVGAGGVRTHLQPGALAEPGPHAGPPSPLTRCRLCFFSHLIITSHFPGAGQGAWWESGPNGGPSWRDKMFCVRAGAAPPGIISAGARGVWRANADPRFGGL